MVGWIASLRLRHASLLLGDLRQTYVFEFAVYYCMPQFVSENWKNGILIGSPPSASSQTLANLQFLETSTQVRLPCIINNLS